MRIIQEISILYRLPKEISLREFLLLDSVRFSFEIIDSNFVNLISELEKTSETNERNVSKTFHYVWTIIDYTNRINDLLYQLPWRNKNEILSDFYDLKEFRNTFQHLGSRNNTVIKKHTPFFGIISWFYFKKSTKKHKLHYLISGISRRTNMKQKVPDTSKFISKINNITLHTVNGKKIIKVELNKVILDLIKLCVFLENRIEEFYKNNNLTESNWSSKRDIHIVIKPEDYE